MERLVMSRSALEAVINSLIKGDITFADFDFLNENRDKVLALCEVSEELQRKTRAVKEAYDAHSQEREAFLAFHTSLHDLWGFCKTAIGAGKDCNNVN